MGSVLSLGGESLSHFVSIEQKRKHLPELVIDYNWSN